MVSGKKKILLNRQEETSMGNITMSKKEVNQIKVFERLKCKQLTQKAAAKMLAITDRQVRNKLIRYRKFGAKGLIHKNRGKPSKRRWCEKERAFSLSLFRKDFEGFGPTIAAEKLYELHNIKISSETLRKEMIKENIWIRKKRKIKYRIRRERRPFFGEMVQIDGSPHDWFEGRAPKCTLLVFIDDATSKVVHLEFAKSESTESLMHAMRSYVEKYGRPLNIYVDYGAVFSININNPERDKITQFERAMKELDINVIHASSPQAKGRVERSNKTHQDRLIKEMRFAKISSIKEANEFLKNSYIKKHNDKFALDSSQKNNVHRSIINYHLGEIFCYKEKRILQNNFVISYKKHLLQLNKEQKTIIFPKNEIAVHEQLDGKIRLFIRKTKLFFTEIKKRPEKLIAPTVYPKPVKLWKPAQNHPWRGKFIKPAFSQIAK